MERERRREGVGGGRGDLIIGARGGGQAAGGGRGGEVRLLAGRGSGKVRVAPGESAGIVDNVVVKGKMDEVYGKIDRSVIVREKVDLAGMVVIVDG